MRLFPAKPDPKDEQIADLRSERDYLRAKLDQLDRQLLAMSDAHAYRLLNTPAPESAPSSPPSPTPTPWEIKRKVYKPADSLLTLQQKARGRIVN